MPTPAERRSAQRKLAKEIKAGTFKPSSVGTQARKVATAKEQLINDITQLHIDVYGNEYKRKNTRNLIQRDPISKKIRPVDSLRKIEAFLKVAKDKKWSPKQTWDAADDYGLDEDDMSALWYN
jgi:hypothetical protein